MPTSIQIPLAPDLKQVYDHASREDQQKLQTLVSLWLRDISSSKTESLGHLMDDISDKALQRGLTPEILESILDDEE